MHTRDAVNLPEVASTTRATLVALVVALWLGAPAAAGTAPLRVTTVTIRGPGLSDALVVTWQELWPSAAGPASTRLVADTLAPPGVPPPGEGRLGPRYELDYTLLDPLEPRRAEVVRQTLYPYATSGALAETPAQRVRLHGRVEEVPAHWQHVDGAIVRRLRSHGLPSRAEAAGTASGANASLVARVVVVVAGILLFRLVRARARQR